MDSIIVSIMSTVIRFAMSASMDASMQARLKVLAEVAQRDTQFQQELDPLLAGEETGSQAEELRDCVETWCARMSDCEDSAANLFADAVVAAARIENSSLGSRNAQQLRNQTTLRDIAVFQSHWRQQANAANLKPAVTHVAMGVGRPLKAVPETGTNQAGQHRRTPLAMTGVVKDELSRVTVVKPCCRKAEVSAMLRFAGGLHLAAGHIVIEAELDTGAAARRLRAGISEVFGHASEMLVLAPSGLRKGNRYVVRVLKGGDNLARQTGLLDSYGRPVRGLPRQIVSGTACDCEAAWRGAFLAHGSLTGPGRSMALEVTCPGSEAALALVGAARRLKIGAKAREVRGVDRVVIRDGDAISAMLTRLGAHDSVLAWEERRMRREVRATANRLANFDDANLRRSARAAVAAGARVERALEILGDEAPEHLTMAGKLRIANRQASLEELGQLADPPLTKDAIAGRIRRLLAMADRRAGELGLPSTEASLTADMLMP